MWFVCLSSVEGGKGKVVCVIGIDPWDLQLRATCIHPLLMCEVCVCVNANMQTCFLWHAVLHHRVGACLRGGKVWMNSAQIIGLCQVLGGFIADYEWSGSRTWTHKHSHIHTKRSRALAGLSAAPWNYMSYKQQSSAPSTWLTSQCDHLLIRSCDSAPMWLCCQLISHVCAFFLSWWAACLLQLFISIWFKLWMNDLILFAPLHLIWAIMIRNTQN